MDIKRRHILKSLLQTYGTGYCLEILLNVGDILKQPPTKRIYRLGTILLNAFKGKVPMFMTTLFGGYQILRFVLHSWMINNELNAEKKRKWVFKISAYISSALAFLFVPKSSRLEIAMFVAVRSVDSYLWKKPLIKSNSKWIAPFLFQLSCWQIMYSWFYYPSTLPKAYTRWISKMADMDENLLQLLRDVKSGALVHGVDGKGGKYLLESAVNAGLPQSYGDVTLGPIHQQLVQKGIPGTWDFIRYTFKDGFVSAMKIYLPIHVLSSILLRRTKLNSKKAFFKEILSIALDAMQSSTFLASFLSICWGTICIIRRLFPSLQDGPLQQNLASFFSGMAIFLEKPSRAKEMALYCLPKAIQSFTMQRTPSWVSIRFPWLSSLIEISLFSLSMGFLLERYENRPEDAPKIFRFLFPFFLVK